MTARKHLPEAERCEVVVSSYHGRWPHWSRCSNRAKHTITGVTVAQHKPWPELTEYLPEPDIRVCGVHLRHGRTKGHLDRYTKRREHSLTGDSSRPVVVPKDEELAAKAEAERAKRDAICPYCKRPYDTPKRLAGYTRALEALIAAVEEPVATDNLMGNLIEHEARIRDAVRYARTEAYGEEYVPVSAERQDDEVPQ